MIAPNRHDLNDSITGMKHNGKKTRIFFFEVHPLMILGIQALINNESELELCGSTSKHDTLIDEIKTAEPDAIILDLSLYTRESLDLLRKIRGHFSNLGIIVLSVHTESAYVTKAQEAGANGYVLKVEEPQRILDAVQAVVTGKNYISDRIKPSDHPEAPPIDSPMNQLSKQEFQILQQIGKGQTHRQIAENLELPLKTVEEEAAAIQKKMDLSTPVELLQFAFHWVHHEGGFS